MYARAVVKSAKKEWRGKPILRKLTARVDDDYRLDLEGRTLVLKVHDNREVRLRPLTSSERVEEFKSWRNYELSVKIADGDIYVSLCFRKGVKLRKPRTPMTVDVNFDNITLAVFKPRWRVTEVEEV